MGITHEETGWVIEREDDGILLYWAGVTCWDQNCHTAECNESFAEGNLDAVRFAREEDAEQVLSGICGNIGRVTQHMWVDNMPVERG